MGKRILVADDSLTIQKAFAMVLGGEDYTLLTARSVDEAMVAAKGGRPDLVIADAVLGAGNGYDLCASLKADPSLRGVPVHILASSQNPLDEARARRVGADGHLLKPFDSQTLLDSVSAALLAPARPAPAPVAERSPGRTPLLPRGRLSNTASSRTRCSRPKMTKATASSPSSAALRRARRPGRPAGRRPGRGHGRRLPLHRRPAQGAGRR